MTTIYFVRHGESESNLITQFAGSLDMPLTQRGREQAALTASYLSEFPIAAVYASDLSRAFETGHIIANRVQAPILAMQDLREIYAGQWEGKTYAQLEREFPDSYSTWKNQIGLAVCDGGESVAQLQQRVQQCVGQIVAKHPNQAICIATHATPIRVMECLWTNTRIENMHTIPWVGNASVTMVEYRDNGSVSVIARDMHEHLGKLSTRLAHNV